MGGGIKVLFVFWRGEDLIFLLCISPQSKSLLQSCFLLGEKHKNTEEIIQVYLATAL